MIDTDKFQRLALNLKEAKASEVEKAAELVTITADWKAAQEARNVHDKAMQDFLKSEVYRATAA